MATQQITDAQVEQLKREAETLAKIAKVLGDVPDAVTRARVLRAVAALHGLDE